METRARKRQKLAREELLHSSESESVEFVDLNDDVFYAIFARMPLPDLCEVSLTCKRLQQLAADYFQRKYPNNRLDIEIFNWTSAPVSKPQWHYRIAPDELYTQAFQKYIRNVGIFMYNYETDPMDAFIYLKTHCYEYLRELVLYRIACQTDKYGELIKTQLATLECIKFDNCYIRDIYDAFLKHTPKLKQLAIKEGRNQNGCSTDWTAHHYPQLKSFIYHSNNVIVDNLDTFLMKNAQITNIMCSSVRFFRLLFRKTWQLDLLYLSFLCEFKFHEIAMELQTYCEQGHVKRFELQFLNGWEPSRFAIGRVTELVTLPAFQGLHCKEIAKKVNFPGAIEKFKHLTILSFGIDHISKKLLHVLSRSLPALNELHIESSWSSDSVCGCRLKMFLRQFAIHAPKLEKISIKGLSHTTLMSVNDLIAADKQRSKIPNAKILTIYLDFKLIQSANFTKPPNGLVQIKPLSQLKPDYRKIY